MKIKSLVSLCAIAALPAFATDVATANTFGAMKVTCNSAKVIICTPWVECQSGGDVKVTDLVMAQGLGNGDAIVVYKDGGFKCWTWSGTAWEGAAITDVNATIASGDAASAPIVRGNGFWFVKNGYTSGSYDLYLYGQVASEAITSTITAGAYNLLANPKTEAVDIKSKITGAAEGDSIQLSSGRFYRYLGSKWTTTETTTRNVKGRTVTIASTVEATKIEIPASTGFWYVSKGSAGGSISWN